MIKFRYIILLFLIVGFYQFSFSQSQKDFYTLIDSAKKVRNYSFSEAVLIYKEAEKSIPKQHSSFYKGVLNNHLGILYYRNNYFDESKNYLFEARDIFLNYKDSIDYIYNLYNIGNYYLITNRLPYAISQNLKVIKIIKYEFKIDFKNPANVEKIAEIEAACLNSLGIVYLFIKNEDKAIEYFKESLEIYEKIKRENFVINLNINIGEAYLRKKEIDQAKFYLFKAYKKSSNSASFYDYAITNHLLAELFTIENQLDSALFYLHQSNDVYEKIYNKKGVYENIVLEAKILFQKNNINDSKIKANEALAYFSQANDSKKIIEINYLLSNIYRIENNYRMAFSHLLQSYDEQKMYIEDNAGFTATEMISIIEMEREEYTDSLKVLSANITSKEFELLLNKKSYTNKLLLILVFFLVFLSLLLIYWNNKNRKNNILLNKSINDKEILFQEVHHRVKNNFQVISSLLNLQKENVEGDSTSQALQEAKQRILSMSLVHEMLYKNNEIQEIDFESYIEELIKTILESYSIDKNLIQFEIETKKVSLDLDKAIPLGLIINETIANSVKYAFEGIESPKISISMVVNNGKINLLIADNGIGIPDKYIKGKESSLGIELIYLLSEQIDGKVYITNGSGTKIQIEF